jgi:hypothetical protein
MIYENLRQYGCLLTFDRAILSKLKTDLDPVDIEGVTPVTLLSDFELALLTQANAIRPGRSNCGMGLQNQKY